MKAHILDGCSHLAWVGTDTSDNTDDHLDMSHFKEDAAS